MNKHLEIHVALTASDVDLYTTGGLPAIGPDTESCANCGTDVGPTHARFIPLALVLNEETHRLLCMSCAAPVTAKK